MSYLNRLPQLLKSHFSHIYPQIQSIIGYGSGVIPQASSSKSQNTVDLIISVKNARRFHEQHLKSKPQDYSGFAKLFGSGYISFLNDKLFPMHFNHISLDGKPIKYSIVQHQLLQKDLKEWNIMSLAGRLHKPVQIIQPHPNISQSIQQSSTPFYSNRRYAFNVALLLLSKKKLIKLPQLYSKICELSYMGDVRMTAKVQNQNKVGNIVYNNLSKFDEIYVPMVRRVSGSNIHRSFKFDEGTKQIEVTYSKQLLEYLLHSDNLPKTLYMYLSQDYQTQFAKHDLSTRVLLAGANDIIKQTETELKGLNRRSSAAMATYTAITGSPIQNLIYLLAKISKKGNK